MKKDRLKELRSKTKDELQSLENDARARLAKLRLDARSGKTSNLKDIRSLSQEVAVLLTLLNEHHGA